MFIVVIVVGVFLFLRLRKFVRITVTFMTPCTIWLIFISTFVSDLTSVLSSGLLGKDVWLAISFGI